MGGDLDTSLVCFAAGTLIATPAGEVPVETLAVGDMVLTKDHGAKPILWIGSKRVTAAMLARNPKLRPIRIRAGALGKGTPTRDLLVSPQHRILVRSKIARNMFGTIEVLVAARQLLAMGGIDPATDVTEIEYFHFLLNQHEIVVSDGAETESLFTGPEAMKAVGPAARAEILTLFPDLAEQGKVLEAARSLQKGRMGRKLAEQHHLHGRALVG
ncbi:Hint domain-containing protein [Pukyongiella litopenaei]|uniref:Hint domain-containing protein n=1 Tax=Pukyongiella litopenaei TaxID=2605946 RepID=A0A2S0MV08_9RHOB|nr:Hint domain-containing protein [Pukyongiella litopenaei]